MQVYNSLQLKASPLNRLYGNRNINLQLEPNRTFADNTNPHNDTEVAAHSFRQESQQNLFPGEYFDSPQA